MVLLVHYKFGGDKVQKKSKEDGNGKWLVDGIFKFLIEPSEAYLAELAAEEQQRQNQKLLDSLIPSADDVRRAETEIQIITLLQEVGLL